MICSDATRNNNNNNNFLSSSRLENRKGQMRTDFFSSLRFHLSAAPNTRPDGADEPVDDDIPLQRGFSSITKGALHRVGRKTKKFLFPTHNELTFDVSISRKDAISQYYRPPVKKTNDSFVYRRGTRPAVILHHQSRGNVPPCNKSIQLFS